MLAMRVLVVTHAPALRHTLAAARSNGAPTPTKYSRLGTDRAVVARESKVRPHRQVRANKGRGQSKK